MIVFEILDIFESARKIFPWGFIERNASRLFRDRAFVPSSLRGRGFGHGAKTVMCRLNVNGDSRLFRPLARRTRSADAGGILTRTMQRKDKKEETRGTF